jgi:hypothetical protein
MASFVLRYLSTNGVGLAETMLKAEKPDPMKTARPAGKDRVASR